MGAQWRAIGSVGVDEGRGVGLLQQAADKGCNSAETDMQRHLLLGCGGGEAAAVAALTAMIPHNPRALWLLGTAHLTGIGAAKDTGKAVEHLGASAAAGLPEASFCLGLALFDGQHGIKQDQGQGIGHIKAAADQLHPAAVEWFEAAKQKQLQGARDAFSKFDTDGSGSIEKGELLKLLSSMGLRNDAWDDATWEQWVSDEFKKADTDRSGTIDFQEFIPFYNACLRM